MKTVFHPYAASPHLLITKSDVVIILTDRREGYAGTTFASLDAHSAGALSQACHHSNYGSKEQSTLIIPSLPGAPHCAVILHELHPGEKTSDASASKTSERQGELAGGKLRSLLEGYHHWKRITVADDGSDSEPVLRGFMTGFWLYDWQDLRYKTKNLPQQVKRALTITSSDTVMEMLSAQLPDIEHMVHASVRTKSLVSAPANSVYPESMAREVKGLAKLGLVVDVLTEPSIAKVGMHALLGVARGSANKPRVVVMRWHGATDSPDTLALVGKGVTFDSGGLSLKPPKSMEDMKWDMAGAATVVGTMELLARRRAHANVIGIVGLVENMPDGNAQRPGDIVQSLSGQTIEVLNTDAEGRLVLADLLTYIQSTYSPTTVIDLATLTGAIIVGLGHEMAGMFANDDALAHALTESGQLSGDRVWRMPLHPRYDELLKSKIADMKNIGGPGAGSITAAQFLQRFVQSGTRWAHLDIAGTAWRDSTPEGVRSGASAFGVRLLDTYVSRHWE